MRRFALSLAAGLLATSALAGDPFENGAPNCSGRNLRFGDHDSFVQQEVIDAGHLRSLKLNVSNAPVTVVGGAAAYEITVCKAAEREQDLSAIRFTLDGNELKTNGPDHRRWSVTYHVRVPRAADLDLSAKNGPMSVRNVEGTVVARSHNGPLSLKNIDGTVDAETRNGPVSIAGGSGTMKVTAQNGPLTVKLAGAAWNGTLDASTKNGPLSVRVPKGFTSGVLVETHGRGPIACNAEPCGRARRIDSLDTHTEPRRIELGSGAVNVRLSTVNGPVTVNESE